MVEDIRLRTAPGDPVASVTARVHRPEGAPRGPGVVLAHGAGGDLDGKGLVALAAGLAARGYLAVRANLPYRESGRRATPRAEASVAGYRAIFEDAVARLGPDRPWVAGGKSYGGRVASLAVADGLRAAGLLFVGYPLHPPEKPAQLRVAHWPRIAVPSLFLEGTRDPFCDLALLREHLPELGGPAALHVVEGGDHSLAVAARDAPDGRRRAEAAVLAEVARRVAAWLAGL